MLKPISAAKADARVLKKFFAEHGVDLSHGVMLEAVARLARHKTWAEFLAKHEHEKLFVRRLTDVAAWPVLAFSLKPKTDEDLVDELHVLPPHATLDNRYRSRLLVVDDRDAVPVEELLACRGHDVVLKAVHSRIPAIDKYGLPWYADEDQALRRVKDELGFAVVAEEDGGLDVHYQDSADDSAERLWFEAYVEPSLFRKLQSQWARSVDNEELSCYRRVLEQAFGVAGLDVDATQAMSLLSRKKSELPASTLVRELSKTMKLDLSLEGPFEDMTVRQLHAAFVRLAKQYYEELVLARSFAN